MRHSLRALKNCNMPDTRLIECSMEALYNYPDIDKFEFAEINKKVIITVSQTISRVLRLLTM